MSNSHLEPISQRSKNKVKSAWRLGKRTELGLEIRKQRRKHIKTIYLRIQKLRWGLYLFRRNSRQTASRRRHDKRNHIRIQSGPAFGRNRLRGLALSWLKSLKELRKRSGFLSSSNRCLRCTRRCPNLTGGSDWKVKQISRRNISGNQGLRSRRKIIIDLCPKDAKLNILRKSQNNNSISPV